MKVGDLVRVAGDMETLGIVIGEQYIKVNKTHPFTRVESKRALQIRWLDKQPTNGAYIFEHVLELVQSVKN
jgi:hypothetical protein